MNSGESCLESNFCYSIKQKRVCVSMSLRMFESASAHAFSTSHYMWQLPQHSRQQTKEELTHLLWSDAFTDKPGNSQLN